MHQHGECMCVCVSVHETKNRITFDPQNHDIRKKEDEEDIKQNTRQYDVTISSFPFSRFEFVASIDTIRVRNDFEN